MQEQWKAVVKFPHPPLSQLQSSSGLICGEIPVGGNTRMYVHVELGLVCSCVGEEF